MDKSSFKLNTNELVVALAVLIVIGVTYWLALPQARTLTAVTSELKGKEAEQAKLEQKYNSLTQLASVFASHQEDIDRLTIAYPTEEQSVEAMIAAQAMAERSGVSVVDITPSTAKGNALPVVMNVTSTYGAFSSLLREFYNNLRPVAINSLTISAGSENTKGLVSANLSVGFGWQPAPSPSAVTSQAP